MVCSICIHHEIAPRHSVCRIMFLSSRTRRMRAAPPDSKKVSQMYFGKHPVPGKRREFMEMYLRNSSPEKYQGRLRKSDVAHQTKAPRLS